jgi:23S rRNA (uracil1939-C5)-methyltransferase
MLEKNEIVCGTVEAVGSNGEGIIKQGSITFFVPACLPGEKVSFKVLKIKNNIGYGKLEEVLTPAEERTRAKCPVFLRCGGCALQHMAYESQLLHKNGVVKDALRKIGGLQVPILPTVASDVPFGYRNKLQMPIGVDKSGETVIGFYAERSHRIVPVSSCAIHPEWAEHLIAILHRYATECAVKGYDEEQKTGALRHIVAREIGGKFLFTLVTAKRNLPGLKHLVALLGEKFSIFSLYLNFNDSDTNVILGEEFQLVHGMGFFEAEEQGIRYEAGPATFLQVNENVRGKLYNAALKTVIDTGDEVVVDAYSGGGLLTAMLAKKAKRVYGIEIVPNAIKNAIDLLGNLVGSLFSSLKNLPKFFIITLFVIYVAKYTTTKIPNIVR